MEQLFPTISWTFLLEATLILFLIYLGLRSLPLIVGLAGKGQVRNPRAIRVLHRVRVIYEAVASAIVVVLFLGVNLLPHGLLVGLLLLLLWNQLHDFFSGRFLGLRTEIQAGQQIVFGGQEAIIQREGPLGVILQFTKGTRHIPYRQLYQKGFTRLSGTHTSNFLELTLTPEEEVIPQSLAGHLLACPYLDWAHLPEVQYAQGGSAEVRLKVLLLDEDYAPGFISLLAEWGFAKKVNH
ncbi:hypothetical protein [Lewinella sp. W8]|uniref:hypothetical protein n=1 Tax=Lewinella sp. W8 TaxID=2528208 RepID=UPI001067EA55|nr:hypothetical protein [Lewinella sp. W8]MTB51236.1 hypothetical protein [Lewinella sp. W8]